MTYSDLVKFACALKERGYQNLVFYPHGMGWRFRYDDFAGSWEGFANDDSIKVLLDHGIVKFQSLVQLAPRGGFVVKKGAPSQNAKGVAKFTSSKLKGIN